MINLTTHILDISIGMPAKNVPVILQVLQNEFHWVQIGEGQTDNDGRIKNFFTGEVNLGHGTYKLIFNTGEYFESEGIDSFYPFVEVMFVVDSDRHYHVPLLLSPYGYSTYRGS